MPEQPESFEQHSSKFGEIASATHKDLKDLRGTIESSKEKQLAKMRAISNKIGEMITLAEQLDEQLQKLTEPERKKAEKLLKRINKSLEKSVVPGIKRSFQMVFEKLKEKGDQEHLYEMQTVKGFVMNQLSGLQSKIKKMQKGGRRNRELTTVEESIRLGRFYKCF